jgi:hypothetical protein
MHNKDHHDLLELNRILKSHEDMVLGNKASILSIITKFNEYEQQCMVQIEYIMNTLLQVKQLVICEIEHNFLKNIVEIMNKDAHSMTSNQRT